MSDELFRAGGVKSRVFRARREPKTHGIKDLIAGNVVAGGRAVPRRGRCRLRGVEAQGYSRRTRRRSGIRPGGALIEREENGADHLQGEDAEFAPPLESDRLGGTLQWLRTGELGPRIQKL